ncbi:nuclear pore membrane glycoprotein 210-like [Styela clava]
MLPIYIRICFIFLLHFCEGAIEPKILLPFHGDYQVNYTIHAEDGCYQWKSLRQEVATIRPIESAFDPVNMCSSSAIVIVMSTQPVRKTTLVLATNVKTGTIFSCDIIVDRIETIDIVSRTRELYLADPPEELKIRALDQEGNTFSSTAGMEFEWSLAQDEKYHKGSDGEMHHPPVSSHSILHIQKFLDTIYVADPYVDSLEVKGKMSDTILISGIQTGAAVVVAKLVSTIECHKAISTCSVRFIVRDKVLLNPSHDIYLLKHAVVEYKVERWREGIPSQITMPCPQYVLDVRDITGTPGSVIHLNKETSVVVGLNGGHSQLYLVDQHLKHYDDSLMEQATSDIYVVEAAYLRFEISPYQKWILEVGRIYEITVHIYSEDNKEIWPANNVRLVGELDNKYLNVLETVKNGTWFLVKALTKGNCDIKSLLKGVVNVGSMIMQAGIFSKGSENMEIFDSPISTFQNLEIFDRIVVTPPAVLFPWQPDPLLYQYTFQASGGSGNYTWSVNETESSSISYTGKVSVSSGSDEKHHPRKIAVKAADIRNSFHFGTATVTIAPPAKLKFAISYLEAEVGDELNLYISMYAKINNEYVAFTDCSIMKSLVWTIHDTNIFKFAKNTEQVPDEFLDPVPQTPPCLMRKVKALKSGHTTVSLSYRNKLLEETLESSTVIAAYEPLKILDPSQIAVVSLASSKMMRFEGGPDPWPLLPNNHEKIIRGDNANFNFHQQLSGKEYIFIGTCMVLGETTVTLNIQNRPCGTNPFPRKAQITLKLSCATPASVKLAVQNLPPSCPLFQNQNEHSVALAGDILHLTVTAFDKFGYQFDNFTSLSKRWISSSFSMVSASTTKSQFVPNSDGQTKHFIRQGLLMPRDVGEKALQLHIDRYEDFVKRDICSKYDCKVSPSVQASVALDIVNVITLSPQSIVMFNRPNFSSSIEIIGGSGYFDHEIKTESNFGIAKDVVLTVHKLPSDRKVILNPVSAGHASLEIFDLCIPKATKTEGAKSRAGIVVSDLSSLFLEVSSPLEVGTTGKATIRLDMRELSAPNELDLSINLMSEPPGIISLGEPNRHDDLIFLADLTALKVGTTTIRASTTSRDGKLISSNSVRIVVFPPLELKPSRITVIRGSEFHLYVEGGPPEDVQIHYVVEDEGIASSSHDGVLSAHQIGNTTVSVKATTKDGQVFHGKSKSFVFVVQIKGVWIDSPTFRFQTGATVPLHVYGYAGPGYDPVNLDSDAAGLVFKWKVNNHAVLDLKSAHAEAGIEIPDRLKFTVLINGIGEGQSGISVSVSATRINLGQLANAQLDAEIKVVVFNPLIISQEKLWLSQNNLLLTPETSYYLLSNRDGLVSRMNYMKLCEECNLNISGNNDDDCVTVNNELRSITTGKSPCQATIVVSAEERFGITQTLAIHVKVKLVSYIIAQVKEKFYTKNSDDHLTGFPVGSLLSLEVQQFDSNGMKFDTTVLCDKFGTNRNDLLEITPSPATNILKVKCSKTGVTIFKIWTGSEYAYSFPLNAVSTINNEGSNMLMEIGSKKCFNSAIVDEDGNPGKWEIKHNGFKVDNVSGAVMSFSRATADLKYFLDPVSTKVALSSKPFSANFDENLLPEIITNAKSKYILPIKLGDTSDICDGLEEEMNKFAQNTFVCKSFLVNTIDAVTVFKPSTLYIPEIGSYACVLDRIDLATSLEEKVSLFEDASFTITLSINSDEADRGISFQNPVNVGFLPAFKLLNSSQVVMRDEKLRLCISAIQTIRESLEINTESRNLEIHEVPDTEIHGVACYEVSYIPQQQFNQDHVLKIFSPLTHQEQLVSIAIHWLPKLPSQTTSVSSGVCVDPDSARESWLMYQYSFSYLGLLIALLVIFITTVAIFLTCGFFKWAFSPPMTTQDNSSPVMVSPQRLSTGMVPYSPSGSYLFQRSSPVQRGSPSSHSNSPSPGRTPLWSSSYRLQDASLHQR